jgi:TatD DNase family protein
MASRKLSTLDAHAHLDPARPVGDYAKSGAVLAMTFSLTGATQALQRSDPWVAWGAGCHPRVAQAQETFDADRFAELAARTAIIGEVGLDAGSRVELKLQVRNFRMILETVTKVPRLVSIHSYRTTALVLKELKRNPVSIPVLHWWTGTAAETQQAVAMGCYFSIHSQVARYSKFRAWVPLERVLLESDHGVKDPPAGIRPRIEWVEYLVAGQYKIGVGELRQIVWQNFSRIIQQTQGAHLLPARLEELIQVQPSQG